MAEDTFHFTVTVPTGSSLAVPAVIGVSFPPRTVRQVDWKVPPGNMGTMSFLLAMGKVPVLPVYGQHVYVTADNKDGSWQLHNYPDSGAWQVVGYNTGGYPHSVLLTFYCDIPARPPQMSKVLSPYEIMPVTDLRLAGPPVARRP